MERGSLKFEEVGKMKKKSLFTLILVGLLAFSLGMGTLAYYTKTFASNGNVVRGAKFTVDSGGTLDESVEFDLTDQPLIPGETRDIYEFEMHKKDTEVPVNYKVTVEGRHSLLDENGPVNLNLYKKTGEEWNLYDGDTFLATEDVEKFKIEAIWAHGENDIKFQNATGKVAINVVATQADGEDTPVDPELEPTIEVDYYYKVVLGRDVFSGVKINVDNVTDAAMVKFEYEDFLGKLTESKTFDIGKRFMFIDVMDMDKDIKVTVYDKGGLNLLHTFDNVTPKNKIRIY